VSGEAPGAVHARQTSRPLGRRRPFGQGLRYSPQLGTSAWFGARHSRGEQSAERLAERGARVEPPSGGAAASLLARGGLGFPPACRLAGDV